MTLGQLLNEVGPWGVVVLLALGGFLLLKLLGKGGRGWLGKLIRASLKAAIRTFLRYVRVSLWAARLRIGIRLAVRLQPDRWRAMCEARKLTGLKRGRVKRTPMGVDVRVTLGGSLTLESVVARIKDLETGLGTRRGAIRVEPTESAHKAVVRITVRNPLAGNVKWPRPAAPVSITTPARLSMNPFGEWTEIDLQQRILIVGASGSGKSSAQRVLAAPVILATDADLEVWDLKQGTESQHYEGKADVRITSPESATARLHWFMEHELPRRSGVMQSLNTSTWPTSPTHRDRVVMVDEGAALIRALSDDDLELFFTFLEQARAYGIYLWWATQFPKATNLPTELRSQMSALIALKMRRMSESRVVFEDLSKEGWTPHRLPGKGWLLLHDDDHQEPEETRAAFIHEREFRDLRPEHAAPTAPAIEAPPVRPAIPAGKAAPVVPPMPSAPPTIPAPRVDVTKHAPAPTPAPAETPAAVPAADAGSAADAVRLALADAPPAGIKTPELILSTGRQKSAVYAALQELQDDGIVVKVGHGRYALADDAAKEA
ncbi:FtsK/SpoIIIE domain-containing protein (plasmid) [Streptomyces sp. NBC_00138]|uniref:FtsK/SpoIIIE domain-containing protein n=1 Tax=Streptomyces sp. NBC_00138 TaxID=2903625 RepID=UPI002F910D30